MMIYEMIIPMGRGVFFAAPDVLIIAQILNDHLFEAKKHTLLFSSPELKMVIGFSIHLINRMIKKFYDLNKYDLKKFCLFFF